MMMIIIHQGRSGVGTYAGAARHRVHLATLLLRPPSGHRPDRRLARLVHILQIRLYLTQARNKRTAFSYGPSPMDPDNTKSGGRGPP